MKLKSILFLFIFFVSKNLLAQDIPPAPNPPRLVNDFVGMLSANQINDLESKLVAYNDSTSTQIVVVIVKSVKPYDMNQYAVELGRQWGVGQKGKNNGIILLWAPGDRKVYIATGYGLEGAIPDAVANRIVDQVIIPNFKEVKYYEGLDEGTNAIIKYASGEYKADASDSEDIGVFPIILFILIVIIFIYLMSRNNRGGGSGNRRYSNSGWPYTTYTGWGRSSGNWGGGWSGGGGGGGGFGGFGGGSFGGGGAGGDY